MSQAIAEGLLRIQAVFLRPDDPFTWASGIQSPIYTDNRLILSYPDFRDQVEEELAQLIRSHFPSCRRVMGTATAGIAHAALVAERLQLAMGYVRSGSKDHGRKNRIEGKLLPGDPVVVVEDLISTGGSVLETVQALDEAGAEVLGVVAIFSYGMDRAKEAFAQAGKPLYTLTDFDQVVDCALAQNEITEGDRAKLLAFRQNPSDESWIHCEAQAAR